MIDQLQSKTSQTFKLMIRERIRQENEALKKDLRSKSIDFENKESTAANVTDMAKRKNSVRRFFNFNH